MNELTMDIEISCPIQFESAEHGFSWDFDAGWMRLGDALMAFSAMVEWPWAFKEHPPTANAMDKLRDYLQRNRGFQVESHTIPNPLRNWRGEVMTDAERLERQRRMYEMWRKP